MSNLAWAEMDGAEAEHGDADLARPNTREEQRRWPLPPEGGVVRIGRASSADVCFSEDSQVSRVHARPGAGPRPVDDRLAGGWTQSDPRPYIGEFLLSLAVLTAGCLMGQFRLSAAASRI